MAKAQRENLLQRVDRLEQELEQLKRELLHQLAVSTVSPSTGKASLFGCVQGGDITEQMIEESVSIPGYHFAVCDKGKRIENALRENSIVEGAAFES